MPDICVRFAPSPTGYLHVGGARTALFNWLYARHYGGKVLLRIEDTDRKRSTPEAVEAIFEGLHWLGLDFDDKPLFQTQRLEAHKKVVEELLERGAAYRCFCDPEQLAQKQKAAQKNGGFWGYLGTCRSLLAEEVESKLAAGEPFAVRFKIPAGETVFNDAVHGRIAVQHREMEDFILMRRNGTPVYQVAVVADDLHMGITHVIRGDDHITNTPKQILIYQALDIPVPTFAHVPLILGPDKRRLSKRHGATSVVEYSERGIMAEAMRNFLALLGWSPGDDREIMELDELVNAFSLEGINASGAVFDETKLEWMNQQYIMRFSDAEVWEGMRPFLQEFCRNEGIAEPTEELGLKLAALFKERLRSFAEAVNKMAYFLRDPVTYDEKGLRKHWKPETGAQVERLLTELNELKSWERDALEACIDGVSEEFGIKRAALIHPVRLALTGGISSPGIFDVMEILGRDTCLRRIESALTRWPTGASD